MELLTVETKNMENNENGFFSKKVIVVFLIGVLIGFLGTWLTVKTPSEPTEEVKTEKDGGEVSESLSDGEMIEGVIVSGDNSISVEDQVAGISVDIKSVSVSNDSWVVVYEDNGGNRGNALGAQLFTQDQKAGVVELLRGTEEGQNYYVAIHKDDGDRAFDLVKDVLIVDETGDPVQAMFKASATLVE